MATNPTPADELIAVPEHLWTITDLSSFLRRCENTARKVAELDDSPRPVFSDGKGNLWDPRSWWDWAADRRAAGQASCTTQRSRETSKALGKDARV